VRLATSIAERLPATPVAVFAHWGAKDSLPPLHFGHDLVVADTWVDHGQSARELSQALMNRGRTVFVIPLTMPPPILAELVEGRSVRILPGLPELLELEQPGRAGRSESVR
jgi:hypothetical protein